MSKRHHVGPPGGTVPPGATFFERLDLITTIPGQKLGVYSYALEAKDDVGKRFSDITAEAWENLERYFETGQPSQTVVEGGRFKWTFSVRARKKLFRRAGRDLFREVRTFSVKTEGDG